MIERRRLTIVPPSYEALASQGATARCARRVANTPAGAMTVLSVSDAAAGATIVGLLQGLDAAEKERPAGVVSPPRASMGNKTGFGRTGR